MTYPEPPIQLDLDPSGYIQGLGQAEKTTDQFGGSLKTAALALAPFAASMNSITPSRAALAGIVGFTAIASKAEQQMSTLRATTRTTSTSSDAATKSFGLLTKQTRELARQMPIGNAGARELVTTMSKMGLTTKDNEKNFTALAKTFVKLGGATGEGPAGLAQGMIQLSRATGTGFNTKRIENLADSLTTVSAKTGASATGILQFSKNIAPLANAAGIGQTKIMGISAAFAKMGEDGFGASTAFNKMLGDMNRSVREGSPEMAKYAMIVGKSADEFTRMFKADPTEAITQVTEAIGQAGAAGPRMLEQLGLEGVRTQKALQQLSAGGNLRSAVSDSTGAYNSNSTEDASAAAFGGLADSTTRLGAAAEQAAEALGTPFLGAVTMVTDVMGGAASVLARGLDTKPVQGTLKALSFAGLALLVAFKAIPTLVSALGLSRLATSGPIKGLLGGYSAGGGIGAGLAGKLGGDAYNAAAAKAGTNAIGTSAMMRNINERAFNAGNATGGFTKGTPTGGPSVLRTLLGGTAQLGAAYMRMTGENVRNAVVPVEKRTDRLSPRSEVNREFTAYKKDLDRDLKGGRIDKMEYSKQLVGASTVLATETGKAGTAARVLGREFVSLGAQTARSTAMMAGRAAKGGLGLLGGPVGAVLTGGMAAMAIKSGADAETAKRQNSAKEATGFMDDYRVAMGKATEATSTFAGQMKAVTKSNIVREMSAGEAKKVTDQDMAAFGAATTKDRVRDYRGMSVEAAARRIQGGVGATGATPDEIQRIQQDLKLSGFNRDRIEAATSDIPTEGNLNTSMVGNVTGQVGDIGGMRGRTGIRGFLGRLQQGPGGSMDNTRVGATIDTLGEGQVTRSDELTAEINERKSRRAGSGVYSEAYATKEQFAETDAAIAKAFKDGNQDLAEQLMLSFNATNVVSDKNKTRKISYEDVQDAGGNYTAAMAKLDKDFGKVYGSQKEAEARGEATEKTGKGWVSASLGNNPLAELFSAQGTSNANSLVTKLMGNPENPQLQNNALMAAVNDQSDQGAQAMVTFAQNATEAANRLGQLDDATIKFLSALREVAQFRVMKDAPFRAGAETRALRTQMAANDARIDPRTDDALAKKKAGLLELTSIRDEELNNAKQMVMQRREVQEQQKRMEADFLLQRTYMDDDYKRQTLRSEEQYGIQLVRSERGYLLQRDRSTKDFQRGMRLAQRDFNKQMARQAEDGARSLYDAYQRIQVAPTWDSVNLVGNLREQNDAIQKQVDDLARLRKQGGSSDLIALMGLNDPKNAQQLATLVSDVANDPKVLGELNKAAADRQKMGGDLQKDPSNIGRTRSAEDFKTQMDDQSFQFKQMLDRGATDYDVTLKDMADDQARSLRYAAEERVVSLQRFQDGQALTLSRMKADIKRADEEIVMDLAGYTETLQQMIDGQIVNFDGKTSSILAGTLTNVSSFMGELSALINTGIDTSVTITTTSTMTEAARPVLPEATSAAQEGRRHGGGPTKYAAGGIATAPHLGLVGEAGVHEAMIPLDQRGVGVLAAAMKRFLTDDQALGIQAGRGVSYVTYDSSVTHEDHSTRFEGAITVQAQDPGEMARQLQQKVARANLTAPATRRK